MNNDVRDEYLSRIYKFLTKEKLPFICIGRPFYSDENKSGDIDLIVPKDRVQEVVLHLKRYLDDMQSESVTFLKRLSPNGVDYKFLVKFGDANLSLQLDIFSHYHWRGIQFFGYEDAWHHIGNGYGIPVLSSEVASCVGALKDIVYGKPVKGSRFSSGYSIETAVSCFEALGFNRSLLRSVFDPSSSRRRKRHSFIALALKKYGARVTWHIVRYFVRVLLEYSPFRQKTIIIALSGPDGSGKSSVIESMCKDDIFTQIFDSIIVRHSRPHYIPAVSSLYLSKSTENKVARSVKEISKAKAILHIAYYSLDFLVDRGFIFCGRFRRKRTALIYDRYVYEYGYQQTFARLPDWALKFVFWVAQSCDVKFFLYSDPDIIRARKAELDVEDIEYQTRKYNELDSAARLKTVFVDSGQYDVDVTSAFLVSEVNEVLR